MGIFDNLFKRGPKIKKIAPAIDGYSPLFTQFGTDIYASDVVQQAIKCIVDEMAKLTPTHIRATAGKNDPVPIPGEIQAVLNNPNPLMTTSEMIEKTMWLLLLNDNAFVVPIFETWVDPNNKAEKRRKLKALYPIKPDQVNFIEDASGTLYVEFWFLNGYRTTLPYDQVIHIKENYSVNDYMGGDITGQADHRALLDTLELNKKLLNGIAKAMNASYAINGIVKYNTMLDDGSTEEALKELERKLNNSESGFLPLDIKADFIPLEHKSELVDEPMLKFIDEKILRNWGVPLCILTGDFNKEQYEAFYQKTLEKKIKNLSEAFTKKIFTEREISFGNKIQFYPKALVFMTMGQTLEMVNILSPTGALYENEKRIALGLPPLPELEGKRYMSLNWVDADVASKYQLGKVNVDVVDESKTVTEA